MRGGYRPGGGRPKGVIETKPRKRKSAPALPPETDTDKIRQMLAMGTKAKARMYQEFLVKISKGEPVTITEKKLMDKIGAELSAEVKGESPPATGEKRDPLTYMLDTMNDPGVDPETRLRAASLAAPYIHPRKGEGAGKKEEKGERAKQAGQGRFKAGRAPLALVK